MHNTSVNQPTKVIINMRRGTCTFIKDTPQLPQHVPTQNAFQFVDDTARMVKSSSDRELVESVNMFKKKDRLYDNNSRYFKYK